MPQDAALRAKMEKVVEEVIADEGQVLLGWRDVPVDNACLSQGARDRRHRAAATARCSSAAAPASPTRRRSSASSTSSARSSRRASTRTIGGLKNDFYVVSMSCRTLVYKGMFLAYQLGAYYADLHDPRFESALALVHQRFSTNTFPSWRLAHPYRMVCHNGEINTVRGNVNWMAARQASVDSELFGNDISKLWPISYEGQSDTACFDNALEFLIRGGYSLPHAAMMLIPEAWAGNPLMDEERQRLLRVPRRADGAVGRPGGDGLLRRQVYRRDARPERPPPGALHGHLRRRGDHGLGGRRAAGRARARSSGSGACSPARCCSSTSTQGRIISDDEIKAELATAHPYRQVAGAHPDRARGPARRCRRRRRATDVSLLDRQQAFGYTQEDLQAS